MPKSKITENLLQQVIVKEESAETTRKRTRGKNRPSIFTPFVEKAKKLKLGKSLLISPPKGFTARRWYLCLVGPLRLKAAPCVSGRLSIGTTEDGKVYVMHVERKKPGPQARRAS